MRRGVSPRTVKIASMIRPIKRYGEAVLHRPAAVVDAITSEIGALIGDMIETMYAAPVSGWPHPRSA